MRKDIGFIGWCVVLSTCVAMALSGAAFAENTGGVTSIRRIPETAKSYPFHGTLHQQRPLDLSKLGYVEEEYLIGGDAGVYDRAENWKPGDPVRRVASGPYVTRILVRRPKDARRFNGSVVVEPLNPSLNMDLPIMWGESYEEFMREGFAWVGVTIKPASIAALTRFDPDRYPGVGMPNPRTSPCTEADINRFGMPSATKLAATDEVGLAWDMLGQVGRLLKSSRPDNPIGRPADRVYMTGQSQSGTYVRTYAAFFARTEKAPRGGPLYDGYLWSGGSGLVPLNQCLPAIPGGAKAFVVPAAGVPVFEIGGEGDTKGSLANRRPDGDRSPDLYRRYEIAGASHIDQREQGAFPTVADQTRVGLHSMAQASVCAPANARPTNFPTHYIFDSAWRNLDLWVRTGRPAPHGAFLQNRPAPVAEAPEAAFYQDENGNAKGGVRTPYLDVPIAKYVGYQVGGFGCNFNGYMSPLSGETLKRLYPSHADYVRKVEASATALERQGWLTPTARRQIVDEARMTAAP